MDQWEDRQTGKTRSKLKVVCDSLTLVGGPNDNDRAKGQIRWNEQQSQDYYADPAGDFVDDELPF